MLDFHLADPEEKALAFAAVHGIWPHADDPNVHLMKRQHSIQHARADWFVGTERGEVITSCGAYPLRLYGPDAVRTARGFGAVYTEERARGRGYATAMLRYVMDHYRVQATNDFILFSDIAPRYYEKMGFQTLPSYKWEIEAAALPSDFPWTLAAGPALADNPGSMDCAYGLSRDAYDSEWIYAKQPGPLRKIFVRDRNGQSLSWILSQKDGEAYLFLESNIPQDPAHWDFFRILVAADADAAGCRRAKGWWTSSTPLQRPSPDIHLRDKAILMWTSGQGERDPWLAALKEKGFRVFESEHF